MNLYDSIKIINTGEKGCGIVAKEQINKGDMILKFLGKTVPQRKVYNPNDALQLDEDLFLRSDGTIDNSLNHSCNPNCYIDFEELTLVTLRDVFKGKEITFDYNASEYDLIEQDCSFTCICGSQDCIGEVKGFKYLPFEHKKKIKPFLSPFLKKKWKEEILILLTLTGFLKALYSERQRSK